MTKAQVEEYLNSLPDDEEQSVYTDEVRRRKSEQEQLKFKLLLIWAPSLYGAFLFEFLLNNKEREEDFFNHGFSVKIVKSALDSVFKNYLS